MTDIIKNDKNDKNNRTIVIENLREYTRMYRDWGLEGVSTRTESSESEPAALHPDLSSIQQELGDCQRCKLHSGRRNIVFGTGNPAADLMFVGEGPGEDEDKQGLPFVGKAGQLLTKIISAMKLTREDVYIANIIKCRPPGNRNPETDEIESCIPFLERQIESVSPRIICTLGSFATQTLLASGKRISQLRGTFHPLERPKRPDIKVLPTFHPAYLLRNPGEKKKVWEDVQKIMTELS